VTTTKRKPANNSNGASKNQFDVFGSDILYSDDAERALLGAIITNPESYYSVAHIKSDDFYLLRHAYIWYAIVFLLENNIQIDNVTVESQLRERGQLTDIGDPAYITQLISSAPSSTHTAFYAKYVHSFSLRRQLLSTADEIKVLAMNGDKRVEEVLSESEDKIVKLRPGSAHVVSFYDVNGKYTDDLAARITTYGDPENNNLLGIPTGFNYLDKVCKGWRKGKLITIAGNTGMGKSSLMLAMGATAIKHKRNVFIASYEMDSEELLEKFHAMQLGIEIDKLQVGHLSSEEWERYHASMNNSDRLRRVFLDDTGSLTLSGLQATARRLQQTVGLHMMIVDYIQIVKMERDYGESMVQKIENVTKGLKEIARELRIPVITASQFSYEVDRRKGNQARLSDLKWGGAIAQNSDIVILMDSKDFYDESKKYADQWEMSLKIDKHRGGKNGWFRVRFNRPMSQFREI